MPLWRAAHPLRSVVGCAFGTRVLAAAARAPNARVGTVFPVSVNAADHQGNGSREGRVGIGGRSAPEPPFRASPMPDPPAAIADASAAFRRFDGSESSRLGASRGGGGGGCRDGLECRAEGSQPVCVRSGETPRTPVVVPMRRESGACRGRVRRRSRRPPIAGPNGEPGRDRTVVRCRRGGDVRRLGRCRLRDSDPHEHPARAAHLGIAAEAEVIDRETDELPRTAMQQASRPRTSSDHDARVATWPPAPRSRSALQGSADATRRASRRSAILGRAERAAGASHATERCRRR